MPFFDIQKRLGVDLDRWMSIQSAEQPHKLSSRCHAFEKEWIECAHGIGFIRAEKECKIEYDDFVECLLRQKTVREWWRWELNYFLISLGLFSVFLIGHWVVTCPVWIGKTFVVKSLYLDTMSRKSNAFRSEEDLLFLVSFFISHIFLSIVPCCSHRIRNYMCLFLLCSRP